MFAYSVPSGSSDTFGWFVLAASIFKVALILSGTTFVYLGYRLFWLGIVGDSEIEAGRGEYKLTFRRAAPGSIFALFGALLIVVTAYKGLDIKFEESGRKGEVHAYTMPGNVWEFRSVPINIDDIQESLNKWGGELGPQGWDLAGVSEYGPDGNRQLFGFFKRIKPAAQY